MLLFALEFCRKAFGLKVPAVFEYYSTRMALAAMTSLLVTIFIGKPFIKKFYEWKIGDRVRSEDCPLLAELHHDKNDTPTMGGVLVIFSLMVSLLLWMDLKSSFTLLLLFTTLSVGSLGAYDDYLKLRRKNTKGISTKKKFLIQAAISFAIALYLLWPPLTEIFHFDGWFVPPQAKEEMTLKILSTREYISLLFVPFFKEPLLHLHGFALIGMAFFIVVVITGSSNAVNLSDGLDGLAGGMVILVAAAFALIAFISNNIDFARYLHILYIEGSGEIAIYLSALAGATLGFLWYNGYPAQVFMGDTGSLTMGAILGVSAVLMKREILLAIIGGVFVVEALSVMLQVGSYRLRNKKRIFLCAPLHHHYEYKGWPEPKVVLRFWIIGLLLAMVGIATLKFQ